MKKAMLRKLRALSEELIGEEETNKIIQNEIEKVLKEIKPKTKKKKSDKK